MQLDATEILKRATHKEFPKSEYEEEQQTGVKRLLLNSKST